MINEKKLIEERPEFLNELHIKNGEYNKGWNACNEWWLNLIEEQPKISLENKTSDWIPVSEKEPSKYGVYLVSGHIHGKQNEHIRVAEYFGEFEVANNFVVTAWQPLPKPYKIERYLRGTR